MSVQSRVIESFRKKFGVLPQFVARAPGRVNLLGEHVDYNEGFVLPAAINRATFIAFSPSDSGVSTINADDFSGDTVAFTLQSIQAKKSVREQPLVEWAKYPAGVAWALAEKNLSVPGMNAVFSSDVPRGSGLSSSASVEMAFGVAWMTLGGWTVSPMELALIGQRGENKYVGVNCGIMDQFASACGEQNRLLLLDCRSLEYRTLPLPENVAIIIADTTVRRKLTSGGYNALVDACQEALRLLKQDLPDIRALRDISVEDFNRLAGNLPTVPRKRARHVVEEVDRTQKAIPLLEAGDVSGFGRFVNECHASLRDLYEVSCPELNIMVNLAQSLKGCYGARLTGAGFGGCTVNLVARDQAGVFSQALAARYESETGIRPNIYVCEASAGAGLV